MAARNQEASEYVIMKFIHLLYAAAASSALLANWPQAGGPDGNWRARGSGAPTSWSVALNQNVVWRSALPNGGQSGIAVWGDRLFLTTFDVFHDGDPKFSGTI